jgi:hypothetical protein
VISDPIFTTLLADHDGFARFVAFTDATDVMYAQRNGGVFVLVTVAPDGSASLAFKPGNDRWCTWSPPVDAERA